MTYVPGDVWAVESISFPLAMGGCRDRMGAEEGGHPDFDFEVSRPEAQGLISWNSGPNFHLQKRGFSALMVLSHWPADNKKITFPTQGSTYPKEKITSLKLSASPAAGGTLSQGSARWGPEGGLRVVSPNF